VQDYHFALLPAMIRAPPAAATILTFWHIPWPNPESFGICPWRREILEGMLGSTILGFHTRFPLQELHRDGRSLPRGAHRA
jgi:trehalose 6-phosphate synthase